MTQEEAVEALKGAGVAISLRAYAGYERGENAPPQRKADRIIEVLTEVASKSPAKADAASANSNLVPTSVQGAVTESRPVLIIELLGREIEIGLYMRVRQEPRRIKSRAVVIDAEANLEAQFDLEEHDAGG